jgi:hypothetical protein
LFTAKKRINFLRLAAAQLLHVCGPEALQKDFRPDVDVDIFTLWNATGPSLREVLRREGEHIAELGTRYPVAA